MELNGNNNSLNNNIMAPDNLKVEDEKNEVERLNKSLKILKGRMFAIQELFHPIKKIQNENAKLKEDIDGLNIENKQMRKELNTLKSENNQNLAKVMKLNEDCKRFKTKEIELIDEVEKQQTEINGDKKHIQQLSCKIKDTESVVTNLEAEKFALKEKVKKLEAEVRKHSENKNNNKKNKKIKSPFANKRNDTPLLSESDPDDTDCIPHEPNFNLNNQLPQLDSEELLNTKIKESNHVNQIKITIPDNFLMENNINKKVTTVDRSIMTEEFYHMKDNPYPLFCDKCQDNLEPFPVSRIHKAMMSLPALLTEIPDEPLPINKPPNSSPATEIPNEPPLPLNKSVVKPPHTSPAIEIPDKPLPINKSVVKPPHSSPATEIPDEPLPLNKPVVKPPHSSPAPEISEEPNLMAIEPTFDKLNSEASNHRAPKPPEVPELNVAEKNNDPCIEKLNEKIKNLELKMRSDQRRNRKRYQAIRENRFNQLGIEVMTNLFSSMLNSQKLRGQRSKRSILSRRKDLIKNKRKNLIKEKIRNNYKKNKCNFENSKVTSDGNEKINEVEEENGNESEHESENENENIHFNFSDNNNYEIVNSSPINNFNSELNDNHLIENDEMEKEENHVKEKEKTKNFKVNEQKTEKSKGCPSTSMDLFTNPRKRHSIGGKKVNIEDLAKPKLNNKLIIDEADDDDEIQVRSDKFIPINRLNLFKKINQIKRNHSAVNCVNNSSKNENKNEDIVPCKKMRIAHLSNGNNKIDKVVSVPTANLHKRNDLQNSIANDSNPEEKDGEKNDVNKDRDEEEKAIQDYLKTKSIEAENKKKSTRSLRTFGTNSLINLTKVNSERKRDRNMVFAKRKSEQIQEQTQEHRAENVKIDFYEDKVEDQAAEEQTVNDKIEDETNLKVDSIERTLIRSEDTFEGSPLSPDAGHPLSPGTSSQLLSPPSIPLKSLYEKVTLDSSNASTLDNSSNVSSNLDLKSANSTSRVSRMGKYEEYYKGCVKELRNRKISLTPVKKTCQEESLDNSTSSPEDTEPDQTEKRGKDPENSTVLSMLFTYCSAVRSNQRNESSEYEKEAALKLSEEVGNQIKAELKTLTEKEEWNEEIFNNVLENLVQISKPKTIVKAITEFITELAGSDKTLDRTHTPPAPLMTRNQQKIISLLIKLELTYPEIIFQCLEFIEYSILELGKKSTIDILEELARIFVILSRIKKDRERVRMMCCDALYCFPQKGQIIIQVILTSWPEVLPIYDENENQFLPKCLAHIIKSYQPPPKFQQHSKIIQLKKLIKQYYNYPDDDPLCVNLLDKLLKAIHSGEGDFSANTALTLLCKLKGPDWTYQKVVNDEFLKIIMSNEGYSIRNNSLKLLGNILKIIPIQKKTEIIDKVIDMMCSILKTETADVKNQEAAVTSLLCLIRFKCNQITNVILTWKLPKELSPLIERQLKHLFETKTPTQWNQTRNKIKKLLTKQFNVNNK